MEHVFIYEKGRISVTGVISLDGFGEREVRIRLESNAMTVRGSGFTLIEMAQSAGKVVFQGKISSVEYSVKAEKASLLKRLFK